MSAGIIDIPFINLFLSIVFLIIPIFILRKLKIKAVKSLLISVIRMFVQLFLVGLYLEVIFKLNNMLLNFVYLIIMISVATYSIGSSLGNKESYFKSIKTIFPAILIPFSMNLLFFTLVIIKNDSLFSSKYVIPLGGMLLGNTMNASIIAINNFNNRINSNIGTFQAFVTFGATPIEAIKPFISDSLHLSIKPIIANIANIGLVTLPGMMTGQILGGSSPLIAIKYQIVVMLAIFSTMCFSVYLSLSFYTKKLSIVKNFI